MIKKTPEDDQRIQKFLKSMHFVFNAGIHDIVKRTEMTAQEFFESIQNEVYDPRGSIYMCFGCGNLLKRNEVREEKYFHINRIWHPCSGDVSGAFYPTPGIMTRYGIIVDYLKKKRNQNNKNE